MRVGELHIALTLALTYSIEYPRWPFKLIAGEEYIEWKQYLFRKEIVAMTVENFGMSLPASKGANSACDGDFRPLST